MAGGDGASSDVAPSRLRSEGGCTQWDSDTQPVQYCPEGLEGGGGLQLSPKEASETWLWDPRAPRWGPGTLVPCGAPRLSFGLST